MPRNLKSTSIQQNPLLVSIIIPNYNKCSFIAETLESVLNQSYSNWEAVVIDDGSTDNSVYIIKSFVNRDSRIRFYARDRLPKCGSVCRNIGIDKSIGDYIIFLDSDDLLQPFSLMQRIEFMSRYPMLDFAVFTTGTFYKTIGDSKNYWIPSKKNHLNKFLSHNLQWNIMAPIWRRNFLIHINGFDEQFPRLQDVELHTSALLQNDVKYKIAYQYPADCYYRIAVERTQQSYFEALMKMKSGIVLFTSKFEKLVKTIRQKKTLRGTLFTFLTQVNYYRAMQLITIGEYESILKDLNRYVIQSKLFRNYSKIFLKFYCFLYQKGAWKVKGFNYYFKHLFDL